MISLAKSQRRPHLQQLLLPFLTLLFSLTNPAYVLATASCSLTYNLQADLTQDIPEPATNADFMEFAWNHFLALNAPSVGGQISVTGDNVPLWTQWSSTADMLNQTNPGPSGSRYYPAACKSIADYQNYRVLQQVGKADDSFLEAQKGGLSDHPVIDSAGHFLRYEILLSPAMYNEVLAKKWNDPAVLADLNTNILFSCGDVSKDTGGGDPANPNMGAIVLKVAWREGNAPEIDATSFHMENLLIYTPNYRNSTKKDTCELKPMAMVGMHMGHKTVKQPNWIWATYEHTENALDCTQTIPAGNFSGASVNTNCPDDPSNAISSLNPNNCGEAGNEACAPCNTAPAMNGIGECVNPFSDPDAKDGWCLDLPPNPVGGISQLCRQVPVAHGYCSTNVGTQCTDDSDCATGASCLQSYPAANDQNTACHAAITSAPGANDKSPWQQYQLISAHWEANSYSSCQNAAQVITAKPDSQPINQQFIREQVVLATDSSGNVTQQRPILGNTSMESYDRANCIACHTRSYLDGACSNDSSTMCSTDSDCSSGGTCTQYNTDLMYFLKLEVAQPPTLQLTGSSFFFLQHQDEGDAKPISYLELRAESENVVAGAKESRDDPRCNGDANGTVKASLRFQSDDISLFNGNLNLPCQGWQLQSTAENDTYTYSDPEQLWGLCTSVVLHEGRSVKAICYTHKLGYSSGQGKVNVMLVTGRLRHCADYDNGPQPRQQRGRLNTVISSNNQRPDSCPAL